LKKEKTTRKERERCEISEGVIVGRTEIPK
jgi:hypothetical protein